MINYVLLNPRARGTLLLSGYTVTLYSRKCAYSDLHIFKSRGFELLQGQKILASNLDLDQVSMKYNVQILLYS